MTSSSFDDAPLVSIAILGCGMMGQEFKTYFCALDWFLRIPTSNRTRSAKVVFAQKYHDYGPGAMASRRAGPISGCGRRMPSTQHIAVIPTPWATRRCAGSAAYDHHSRRKSTLTVPYFWVRFNMHDINRIIDKINI